MFVPWLIVRRGISFFAGAFSFGAEDAGAFSEPIESASRLGKHHLISRYRDRHFVLIHGDPGILPERGWRESAETIAATAGSLYVEENLLSKHGEPELSLAAASLGRGEAGLLAHANGTFALCVYNRRDRRLRLASDSLGARPLYYSVHSNLLFFSTSIDVLKRLGIFPLTADLTSYFEQESLYYPTGPRSTIREINVLVDNQVLEAGEEGIRTLRYFDWTSVPQADEPMDALAARCAAAFRESMRSRVHSSQQVSLLSGGLDSRLIVADLQERGCRVEAINLSRADSQDAVYAQRFAGALGVPLCTVPWSPRVLAPLAGDCTAGLLMEAQADVEGRAVFSGDGGGETFGLLLLDEQPLSLMRQGLLRQGVRAYLNHYQPPKALFRDREMRREVAEGIYERVEEDLRSYGSASLEKALHIFTLCHDMRRHLYSYFNRSSEVRTELLLPFYDRRVIESVVRIPVPLTPYLKHKLYLRILEFLPSSIGLAPWQVYRGHAPCPVPDPDPPADQWSVRSSVKNVFVARCARLVLSSQFPPFLRRRVALAAIAGHCMGHQNYDYIFKTCIGLGELCASCDSYSAREDSHVLGSRPNEPLNEASPACETS